MRALAGIVLASLLASPCLAQTGTPSNNYGGYVQTAGGDGFYTSVQATYRVPWVIQGSNTNASNLGSIWAGIGGVNSQRLIQTGVQEQVITSSGRTFYIGFYEKLSSSSVQLDSTMYPVKPGDTMTSIVSCASTCVANNTATTWDITLQNVTEGWTFQLLGTVYKSNLDSADFIQEASSVSSTIQPLPNYGKVTFISAHVNGGAPALDVSQAYYANVSGDTSNPSSPNGTTDGFSVCRGASNGYTACTAETNLTFKGGKQMFGAMP